MCLLSPSIFNDQSKVMGEGTPASECSNTQHFSFEARTLLTSGVIDLGSNPEESWKGQQRWLQGECLVLGKCIKNGKLKQPEKGWCLPLAPGSPLKVNL